MKPGAHTSEFWLALAATLAAVTLAITGNVAGDAALAAIGASSAGYSIARGVAKHGQQPDIGA